MDGGVEHAGRRENDVLNQRGPVRVCITGAECTGKTTLAQALGRHYGAPVLLERGRAYFTEKADRGDATVFTGDIINVVDLQVRLEDSAPLNVPLVLLDTDVFTIAVWHERYASRRLPELDRLARVRQSTDARIDLYLLLTPDIPFVHDGVRTSEAHRDEMHEIFRHELVRTGRRFIEISGEFDARFAQAVDVIDAELAVAADNAAAGRSAR